MTSSPDNRLLRRAALAALLLLAGRAAAETSFYTARVAPVLERHCVACHGADKHKGGLRLDSLAGLQRGGTGGPAVVAGNAAGSELLRRVRLPATDEEVMPSDGKPLLSAAEIRVLELWIARGASGTAPATEFPDAPAAPRPRPAAEPLAPDWRPQAEAIRAWEQATGLRLQPRSAVPADGLRLRTASAPSRCDDAALARLGGLAPLIVEAELARTRVTDAGLAVLSALPNLRFLDLTRTAVTSAGLTRWPTPTRLERINLTGTAVDDAGARHLRSLPSVRQVWTFAARTTDSGEAVVPATP